MQIRDRLTLRFSVIVIILLSLFSLGIYYVSSAYREDRFYDALYADGLTEGRMYSKDVKEIDTTMLRIIDKNTLLTPETGVDVYSDSGKLVYRFPQEVAAPVLSKNLLDKIKSNNELREKDGKNEAMWIYYKGKLENAIVYIYGYDEVGYDKLKFLAEILSIGCFIAFFIAYLLGYFYSRQMLSPINSIISRVREITASNLDLRLPVGKNKDELDRLAQTFNDMLNGLEEAFEMKKDFISNASHELRTPLGILMVQIEVAMLSDRTSEEYKKVLASMLEDIKRLRLLMNGLLELTEANMSPEALKLFPMRIDELLWQAKSDLINQHPAYKVIERYTIIPEDQKKLIVYGNELLCSALMNIMNNGCKYSYDNQVYISLEAKDNVVTITCTDMGIGIAEEDLKKVYQPFYRGVNAKSFSGNGLGLALTKKIIELHNGVLDIETKLNEYTKVTVILPIKTE
ncbi:MAG TPA: ATP-binding protein [Bacteroidia bacterium]|jgi:two-component system heavy metal sensor histidine kinase CusS|nr:ATP-binding protein [Bacteroidia bacterium]